MATTNTAKEQNCKCPLAKEILISLKKISKQVFTFLMIEKCLNFSA